MLKESPTPELRRQAAQVASNWKSRLVALSKDSTAIAVIVLPFESAPKEKPWFFPLLQRILNAGREQFSDRWFEVYDSVSPGELRREIDSRGFQISQRTLRGHSFGEWFRMCLDFETKQLETTLGLRSGAIQPVRELSFQKKDWKIVPQTSKRKLRMVRKSPRLF